MHNFWLCKYFSGECLPRHVEYANCVETVYNLCSLFTSAASGFSLVGRESWVLASLSWGRSRVTTGRCKGVGVGVGGGGEGSLYWPWELISI